MVMGQKLRPFWRRKILIFTYIMPNVWVCLKMVHTTQMHFQRPLFSDKPKYYIVA